MRVLCLDVGSSSCKFALYDITDDAETLLDGADISGGQLPDIVRQCEEVFARASAAGVATPDAIGHRIVFGGERHTQPAVLNPQLQLDLDGLVRFDPLHMTPQLQAIRQTTRRYPDAPQVLCFDTAFHHRMPRRAKRLPLPASLGSELQRYGFHGLSYEYVVSALEEARAGRVAIAHLGGGASMCALLEGQPCDTTMGFSPLSGVLMGTRPGDLDPGAVLHLMERGLSAPALTDLLYQRSGLLALSETTADVRALLERTGSDPRAAFAIEMFVYSARKQLGAMIAAVGGLDTLIFTGGVGEHASAIRAGICEPFAFAGLALERSRNEADEPVISTETSRVRVRVIRTNEGLMIARHTRDALAQG
jgi:acetate kinase